MTAIRIKSANNLKQMTLALHIYMQEHYDRIPSSDGTPYTQFNGPGFRGLSVNTNAFESLVDYVDGGSLQSDDVFRVPQFLSPADPTIVGNLDPQWTGISYSANAFVFRENRSFPTSVTDGVSNTIFFIDGYQACGGNRKFTMPTDPSYKRIRFQTYSSIRFEERKNRATLAEGGPVFRGLNRGDVHPITENFVTRPSRPGVTFQVRPERYACDATLPVTAYSNGQLVSLGDGSVRFLSTGISPELYWGAITPDGGEVLSDW
jgi:hypothetical protein